MTVAVPKLTFEEYLTPKDGTGTRDESVNGERVPMTVGTCLSFKVMKNGDRLSSLISI